jgi:hypothetical protein
MSEWIPADGMTTARRPTGSVAPCPAVKLGLVVSLARPGGNLTGINFLSAELTGWIQLVSATPSNLAG